jgi:pimeloyl-ACP methyl ester carboxylesterase
MLDRTVHYVQCGDGQVAYSAFGSGPLELLLIDDWAWHLEAVWDDPDTAAFYERLASFARVVMWNRRGVGLSDPLPPDQLTTIDSGLDDVIAVLDATGLERPAVMGFAGGVALAVVLAATHPERVSALVLAEDTSRLAWGQDRSNADALFDWFINEVETGWGTGAMAQANSPIRANDPRYIAWMARMERLTCSPRTAVATWRATYATDLSQILPSVAVPTLVIHMLNCSAVIVTAVERVFATEVPRVRPTRWTCDSSLRGARTMSVASLTYKRGRRVLRDGSLSPDGGLVRPSPVGCARSQAFTVMPSRKA